MTIPAQISPGDARVLQNIMRRFAREGTYRYLEIGSYLGGTLYPHLNNPACEHAWSVDTRSTLKIRDERAIDYAYTVTTQDMLDLFEQHHIPTHKLTTIDGSIEQVPDITVDLVFIDGEHTNTAALNDARCCLRFDPAVILFHDDWIVHQGIDLFVQEVDADVYKLNDSDITAVVLGRGRWQFADFENWSYTPWQVFLPEATAKLNGKR